MRPRIHCEEILFILVRFGLQHWRSDDCLDDLWKAGLVEFPRFSRWEGRPRVIAASDDTMTARACRLLELDLSWDFVPRPPEGSQAKADARIHLSGRGSAAPGVPSLVW